MIDQIQQATGYAESQARLMIANRCKTDLFYLCKYILNYDLMTEKTHGELCRYTSSLLPHAPKNNVPGNLETPPIEESLYQAGNSDTNSAKEVPTSDGQVTLKSAKDFDQFDAQKNFLMILMPRGTFKSSVVTIGFSLQTLLNDPDARILIDSETFSKSKAFLMEIKGHLESNDKFREVYKTLFNCYPDDNAKSDTWSDSQLNISARKRRRKEATLSCSGVDVTKTGMHYDLIIGDDWMSENNITTKEQIDKVKTHYKLALSLLDPGKPLIIIGTRWDFKDIYQHIIDNEAHRFNIIIRRAYNPDGSLFFPERLTEKFLEETKKSQGSYIFSCQYMNNPIDAETAVFKQSDMERIEWNLVKSRPINWYTSVDPSAGGEYADYGAIVTAGMDQQSQLYVRDVVKRKMKYSDIIDEMFNVYFLFKPREMCVEIIGSQKTIEFMLEDEQKRRGQWLPIKYIRGRNRQKEERIKALAPYYEYHRIFHVKECRQLDDLEYEMINFPKGENDDAVDALATILEIARPGGGKLSTDRKEKKSKMLAVLTKPRSSLTGI